MTLSFKDMRLLMLRLWLRAWRSLLPPNRRPYLNTRSRRLPPELQLVLRVRWAYLQFLRSLALPEIQLKSPRLEEWMRLVILGLISGKKLKRRIQKLMRRIWTLNLTNPTSPKKPRISVSRRAIRVRSQPLLPRREERLLEGPTWELQFVTKLEGRPPISRWPRRNLTQPSPNRKFHSSAPTATSISCSARWIVSERESALGWGMDRRFWIKGAILKNPCLQPPKPDNPPLETLLLRRALAVDLPD